MTAVGQLRATLCLLGLLSASCSHGVVRKADAGGVAGDTGQVDAPPAPQDGSFADSRVSRDGSADGIAPAADAQPDGHETVDARVDAGPECVEGAADEVCDGLADEDCDGLPDDMDPDCTCVDGATNGLETDEDCGGPDCDPCGLGDACVRARDCDARRLLVCRGARTKSCSRPASCKEVKQIAPESASGDYLIACSPGVPYMRVHCDMDTAGGGWMTITQALARLGLSGTLVAVEAGTLSGFGSNSAPYTLDEEGAHTYHYSFDVPCGFSEFFLKDYKARGYFAGTGIGTSDIVADTFVQSSWERGYLIITPEPAAGVGDISFGSGSSSGPLTSFAAQGVSSECDDCELSWPAESSVFDLGATSTVFRIGWGEAGTQSEGWLPWWQGTIMLR